MDKLIKDIFQDECNLEINAKLIQKIHSFQTSFVNKNKDHITFFGGHLLGVDRVRFTSSEENAWFEDILEVNEYAVRERVHKLDAINPDFNVSSDIFNISCVWLTHAIFVADGINDKLKQQGMIDVMLIMNIRFITSRLAHYFRHPADVGTAEETYNQLSYKYSIKIHQTWFKVLENRAIDTIIPSSIHYQVVSKMNNDTSVVIMINDCQTRIRDMIKNIFEVYLNAKRSGSKLISSSSVINHDGSEILKDDTRGLTNYITYLKSTLSDRESFIKDDLVLVITKIMETAPEALLRKLLEWVADNYSSSKFSDIDAIIDKILIHSFNYVQEHRSIIRSNINLTNLLGKLKGVYTSSRSSDADLLEIRIKCEELAFLATNNKNKNVLPSVRTAFMLYVVSRAFTKNHYS